MGPISTFIKNKYTVPLGLFRKIVNLTVGGPLIWYESAKVRLWTLLNINNKDAHHMGMSQMCTEAGDYFRTSKPNSEKLWRPKTFFMITNGTSQTYV